MIEIDRTKQLCESFLPENAIKPFDDIIKLPCYKDKDKDLTHYMHLKLRIYDQNMINFLIWKSLYK